MLKGRVFKVGTPFEKSDVVPRPLHDSLFGITETAAATKRRELYNHRFSLSAIRRIEPLIHRHIGQFLDVLTRAAKEHKPIDLSRSYRCLTADVLTYYALGEELGAISSKDFKHPFIETFAEVGKIASWSIHYTYFFNLLYEIICYVPDIFIKHLLPSVFALETFELVRGYKLIIGYDRANSVRTVPQRFKN